MRRVEVISTYKADTFSTDSSIKSPTFAKSAMVPHGYRLSVFAENNFKARIQQIVGGEEEEGEGRAVCVDFEGGAMAKSMRITRSKEGRITSYWKAITTSETLTYTVSVGISSTNSTVDKDSSVDKLTNSIKTGISLGSKVSIPGIVDLSAGYTRDETKTDSTEKTLSREITTTASSDMTTATSTTCTAPDNLEDGGVGLWQWVLETEDHSTSANTAHTVCRFGTLAKSAPTCDWMDCLNIDCSLCDG